MSIDFLKKKYRLYFAGAGKDELFAFTRCRCKHSDMQSISEIAKKSRIWVKFKVKIKHKQIQFQLISLYGDPTILTQGRQLDLTTNNTTSTTDQVSTPIANESLHHK